MRALETVAAHSQGHDSMFPSIPGASPVTTTDADSRVQLFGSWLENFSVRVEKAGYRRPCRAAIALVAERVRCGGRLCLADATISVDACLLMPVIPPTAPGTVFERGIRRCPHRSRCEGDWAGNLRAGLGGDRARQPLRMRLVATSWLAWTGVWGFDLWIPQVRRSSRSRAPITARLGIELAPQWPA